MLSEPQSIEVKREQSNHIKVGSPGLLMILQSKTSRKRWIWEAQRRIIIACNFDLCVSPNYSYKIDESWKYHKDLNFDLAKRMLFKTQSSSSMNGKPFKRSRRNPSYDPYGLLQHEKHLLCVVRLPSSIKKVIGFFHSKIT